MDINWLVNRIKNILVTPQTEWPVVGAEPMTVKDVYLRYVLIVAGLAAVMAVLLNGLVIGLFTYAVALGAVFLLGVLADALAPGFGGERNLSQGVKLIGFAATAGWIAALFSFIPWLGGLIAFAGFIYTLVQLYFGAPYTTKVPKDRALGYVVVIAVIWFAIWIGTVLAAGAMMLAGSAISALGSSTGSSTEVEVDPDSALGKLEQFGKSMEEASKQMEAAEKSGDAQAQAEAASKMLGTLMGGGKVVEAVGTDKLKPLAPDTLGGLPRTSLAAEKSAAMGLQVSNVRAEYGEGERRIRLEISDTGGASGVMGLASWALVQTEREDDTGYEKTYKDGANMVHEKWDSGSRSGTYNRIVADRFVVNLEAENVDMDDLKAAIAEIDLDALAAMKDEGVQQG